MLQKKRLPANSSQDLLYIEQQLGRKPKGILEVTVRSQDGKPLVVKTKPVLSGSDNEVFPTLYYLVNRSIIEQVSKLESESFLSKMQQKVDLDNNFKAALIKSQLAYQQERNKLAPKHLGLRQKEALNTGIGGVKDLARIKCLHCHLAHYLATGKNPVGEEVYRTIRHSKPRCGAKGRAPTGCKLCSRTGGRPEATGPRGLNKYD